jgi:hypothetical protein
MFGLQRADRSSIAMSASCAPESPGSGAHAALRHRIGYAGRKVSAVSAQKHHFPYAHRGLALLTIILCSTQVLILYREVENRKIGRTRRTPLLLGIRRG